MLHVRYDSKEINKILNNAVSYSYGFLEGTEIDQIVFNKMLADYTIEALGKYIDSHARMEPEALHHVYEWDRVGDSSSRLFEFTPSVSKRVIHIEGKFLKSRSTSSESDTPFFDKADIMENAIAVTIEPNQSDVLAFEDDGEMVFTTTSVYIAHPGGDAVEGSFGRTVDDFFGNYFTNALLIPFMQTLSKPVEYTQNFAAGTKGGKAVGINAGRKYIRSAGDIIE